MYTQVDSENLPSHSVDRLDKHLSVIVTRLSAIEDTVDGAQSSRSSASTERCVTDRLRDVEASVRRLNEGAAVTEPAAAAAAAAAAAGATGGSDVQSILVSTSEKMTIYEGVITVLNREVEKLSTQVTHIHQMSPPVSS